MKRFFAVIGFVLVIAGIAHAAMTVATFGRRGSNGYPLTADSDGNVAIATGTTVSGGTISGSTISSSAISGAAGSFTSLASTTGPSTFTNMVVSNSSTVALISTTTSLTAANIVKNSIFVPTVSGSFTLDTGANLASASTGIAVGSRIPFIVTNASTGTFTLVGNTGMALGGAWTVPTLQTKTFNAVVILVKSICTWSYYFI